MTSLTLESYAPLAIYYLIPIYEVFNTCVLYINIDFSWVKEKISQKIQKWCFHLQGSLSEEKTILAKSTDCWGQNNQHFKTFQYHSVITSWSTIPTAGIYWLTFTIGQWFLADNKAMAGLDDFFGGPPWNSNSDKMELQEIEVRPCLQLNFPIIILILLNGFHKFQVSLGANQQCSLCKWIDFNCKNIVRDGGGDPDMILKKSRHRIFRPKHLHHKSKQFVRLFTQDLPA